MSRPTLRHALISVSDKTGLLPFARMLVNDFGFTLLSTGGTARLLRDAGLPVRDVSDYTGFPEMMDGRVKTLHPKVHGGLLARRADPEHRASAEAHGIEMIDLVVVNLYPFAETVARAGVTVEEAIEQIDIGGPSMLRSAAKNHESVTVVCDPSDYDRVLAAIRDGEDGSLPALRRELAVKVFARTSAYDAAIAAYLGRQEGATSVEPDLGALSGFPGTFRAEFPLAARLRYGENPHQHAALYGRFFDCYSQLQGKELSYNNLLDISAATWLIGEFEAPSVAILKHTNPCGVGSGSDLSEAWEKALATDRQAPFGGIIAVNRVLDQTTAEQVADLFCEVIIAPGFSEEARLVLARKKNLRLIEAKEGQGSEALQEIRSVVGGILVQDRDRAPVRPDNYRVVTRRQPTPEEWEALLFGWRVVRHVKSNAIVYAGRDRTLGIGAGQMARVDSARIAAWKAGEAGLSLAGSVVASDAFFPFPDGLLAAAGAGATAAIQPGGSVRDAEVIAAADEAGLAMVFTGVRHFRH